MRILLIAPDSKNLDLSREISGVVNSHANQVYLLSGIVSEADIEHACGEDNYDVMWFAAHGGPDGIIISGGQTVTAEALVPYVRQCGASLVFINTCSSLELAHEVSQQTDADVVCTVRNVLDKTAMRTGVFFANQLAKGASYRQAYENSKPGGNRVYLYITNSKEARQEKSRMPDSELVQSTSNGKQLDRLTVAMEDLRKQVVQIMVKQASIEAQLDEIKDKLIKQGEKIDKLEPYGRKVESHVPWHQWALLFACVVIIFFALVILRLALGGTL